MEELTHFDQNGNAVMVDVSEKEETKRMAVARGVITVSRPVFQAVTEGTVKKGDVLGVAQVAGIMAAKKNSELIPMCHLLMLTSCKVEFIMHEEASEDGGKNRGGDGSADRRQRGASDHLRYVQGHGQRHGDRRHLSCGKTGRKKRHLQKRG